MDYFEIHRESKRNMMLGRGVGFEMRYSLGLAVFSGMVGVTFFGLFFTPVFYYLIDRWTRRPQKNHQHTTD